MPGHRFVVAATLLFITACGTAEPTGPAASPTAGAAADQLSKQLHDGRMVPGSSGNSVASSQPLGCSVEAPLTGSVVIGPSGGTLDVGPNRLIVPPGALDHPTTLSGTVTPGPTFHIDFQPHGLRFKKPAGLILDASSCTSVPNIVYLDEDGGVAEHIEAVFSTWWHTIAAPIDHFSGYMLEV